jgi:hypothetical protein
MTKPSWNDAPEWAQWLAQDGDTCWWWFEEKPAVDEEIFGWISEDGRVVITDKDAKGYAEPALEWRETLEQRPQPKPTPTGPRLIARTNGPAMQAFVACYGEIGQPSSDGEWLELFRAFLLGWAAGREEGQRNDS